MERLFESDLLLKLGSGELAPPNLSFCEAVRDSFTVIDISPKAPPPRGLSAAMHQRPKLESARTRGAVCRLETMLRPAAGSWSPCVREELIQFCRDCGSLGVHGGSLTPLLMSFHFENDNI
jgi:hypothetical protein